MKLRKFVGRWGVLSVLLLTGFLLAGCRTGGQFTELPDVGPAPENSATGPAPNGPRQIETIVVGDDLVVTLSDTPQPIPLIRAHVREDGKITVVQNIDFVAAGKTLGELAKEIHKRYVPDYYATMTVQVDREPQTRFYYVGGEVKVPGRQVYISRIRVLGAIKSAGDFTDFANKKQVRITRANGKMIIINAKDALKDPSLDPEVFPGDNINVPRRYNPFSF